MNPRDIPVADRLYTASEVALIVNWFGGDGDRWQAQVDGDARDVVNLGRSPSSPVELQALGLLVELFDPNPCRYDHNDTCQEHNLHQRPCPHETAKALLKSVGTLTQD